MLQGSSQTCDVSCVNGGMQTVCVNNDGCCPAGCTTLSDNDCQPACGNTVVEAGETCDPPSVCNTIQAACLNDANTVVAPSGSAAACTFVCNRTARTCGPGDTFCPTNVSCGPASDGDCAGCGNGRIETGLGETCDPVSTCNTQKTACVSDANNVRTSSGSTAACTYRCTTTARTCGPADGFCPTGCGPTLDIDCNGCGNGRVEAGETCDVAPASVTCTSISCDDGNACTADTTSGSAGTCNVACAHATIATCTNADGCCPAGCNATNDNDCGAVCGNGVREGGETCEVAPATPVCSAISCNDNNACTTDTKTGTNGACNVACQHAAVTACVSDGCCPGGGRGACTSLNDVDCTPVCGNGVLEAKETCEVAPSTALCSNISCDDGDACTTDKTSGSAATCDLACAHAAITACIAAKDGCCPRTRLHRHSMTATARPSAETGSSSLAKRATRAIIRVAGACPTSCPANGCTLYTLNGAGTCNAQCVVSGTQQTCVDADGCCPAGCTDYNDTDCPTKNDDCASATDISKGGDFPFSLLAAKEDIAGSCTANDAEVFFQFKMNVASLVYLDVYDTASETSGENVNVALELYSDTCPAKTGAKPVDCDYATGARSCNSKFTWPRILRGANAGAVYYVAARVLNAKPGRYVLRMQRIPTACLVSTSDLTVNGASGTVSGDTCKQNSDLIAPTCNGQSGGLDNTYYIQKCPGAGISLSTCSANTVNETVLRDQRSESRLRREQQPMRPRWDGARRRLQQQGRHALSAQPSGQHREAHQRRDQRARALHGHGRQRDQGQVRRLRAQLRHQPLMPPLNRPRGRRTATVRRAQPPEVRP